MGVIREDNTEQGIVVLTPTDELLTADVIQEVSIAMGSTSAKYFVIDFKNVRCFVSGSLYPHAEPIMPLMRLHKRLLAGARRLVLCHLSSDVAEVFRITRLDQFFEVRPDRKSATSTAVGESVE